MRNKIKGNAGFTLIELLLVIAIIAILAGVIFVAYGETWMISATNTATTTCNLNCGTVASTSACVDLSGLKTEGYLANVPVSPSSAGLNPNWSSNYTGFTIKRSGQFITITSCEYEGTEPIFTQR
ncbi:MAG: type II secretion system protein [Candidatus Falkowbacteria bacterium]|nr:type II secretion system protein [Candidatus Falkowbacteria bacterium]